MQRIILSYGVVCGLIVIVTSIIGLSFADRNATFEYSAWIGYLVMLVALSMIFVATKRYRDQIQGGIITFGEGLQVGLGIAAVAGIVYAGVWEIYLFLTDYTFMDNYTQSIIDARQAAGASANEMTALLADMDQLKSQYANPLYRIPMTFIEIFPVGFVISLVSAGLLRTR